MQQSDSPSDSLWIPNADQQRAIETVTGLCTVIAGPGTGKTATLAAKTDAIMSQGGRPLAVTYTRAAAQELVQRLAAQQIQATACTCHSLAFKIFSRLAFSRAAPRLLDSHKHEREAILRQVLQRLTHAQHTSPDRLPSLQELGERVSRLKTADARWLHLSWDDANALAYRALVQFCQDTGRRWITSYASDPRALLDANFFGWGSPSQEARLSAVFGPPQEGV